MARTASLPTAPSISSSSSLSPPSRMALLRSAARALRLRQPLERQGFLLPRNPVDGSSARLLGSSVPTEDVLNVRKWKSRSTAGTSFLKALPPVDRKGFVLVPSPSNARAAAHLPLYGESLMSSISVPRSRAYSITFTHSAPKTARNFTSILGYLAKILFGGGP